VAPLLWHYAYVFISIQIMKEMIKPKPKSNEYQAFDTGKTNTLVMLPVLHLHYAIYFEIDRLFESQIYYFKWIIVSEFYFAGALCSAL
jgi:hypothetical protein